MLPLQWGLLGALPAQPWLATICSHSCCLVPCCSACCTCSGAWSVGLLLASCIALLPAWLWLAPVCCLPCCLLHGGLFCCPCSLACSAGLLLASCDGLLPAWPWLAPVCWLSCSRLPGFLGCCLRGSACSAGLLAGWLLPAIIGWPLGLRLLTLQWGLVSWLAVHFLRWLAACLPLGCRLCGWACSVGLLAGWLLSRVHWLAAGTWLAPVCGAFLATCCLVAWIDASVMGGAQLACCPLPALACYLLGLGLLPSAAILAA